MHARFTLSGQEFMAMDSTPGHTPGHTCLLLEDGTAFAADLIGSFPRPRLQSLLATDWGQLHASLARLQAAQPRWIYTGHARQRMPGMLLNQIQDLAAGSSKR